MRTSARLAAILLLLLSCLACSRLGGGTAADEEEAAKAPSTAPAFREDWQPDECKGEEYAVLSGDPEAPGKPFVVRFRWQAGVVVPPHWHPIDEHVTVIRGAILWGMGGTYSPTAGELMKAGSYALMPMGMRHFATVKQTTVVQIHGVGPFKTTWVGAPCEPSGEKADEATR